jgi:DNA-binding CsgD family transcriptional regulator
MAASPYPGGGGPVTGRQQQLVSLPPMETALIIRFAHGQQQRQIARELGLNENVVKALTRSAFELLGATNNAHAVALAIGLGLVPHDCALTPVPQGGSHVR